MNLKEYQKQAKRTCPSLGDIKLDLAHMVLGINSEITELEDAIKVRDVPNIGEEIADACWYIANYCTFRHLDFHLMKGISVDTPSKQCISNIYSASSNLNDLVKKHIAYNKPLDTQEELKYLYLIVDNLQSLLDKFGLGLEKCLQTNIDKLKARFPDKFTEENANNRNLEKERKILEKGLES